MSAETMEYLVPRRGQAVVACRDVQAWKDADGSQTLVTVPQGERLVYVNHGHAFGSDPAYIVTLCRTNGERVQIDVGWFNLRRADFRLVEGRQSAETAG